jgi:hypothetical protein
MKRWASPPRHRIEHRRTDHARFVVGTVETIDNALDAVHELMPDLEVANAGGMVCVINQAVDPEQVVIVRRVTSAATTRP